MFKRKSNFPNQHWIFNSLSSNLCILLKIVFWNSVDLCTQCMQNNAKFACRMKNNRILSLWKRERVRNTNKNVLFLTHSKKPQLEWDEMTITIGTKEIYEHFVNTSIKSFKFIGFAVDLIVLDVVRFFYAQKTSVKNGKILQIYAIATNAKKRCIRKIKLNFVFMRVE